MFPILFAAVLLIVPDGGRCGSHHETTTYVDTMRRVSFPAKLQNGSLDPYTLPDFEVQSQSDHRITVKGKFQRGRLTGLSQINRIGQCGPPANTPQGNTTFNCTIGFNIINATYSHVEIKYGILPHSTSVVKANLTGCFGVMEITSNRRGNLPHLHRFQVVTLGQVNSGISGGVLKGEFSHIKTDFIHRFMNSAQQVLLGPFTNALAAAVSSTPLPSGLTN